MHVKLPGCLNLLNKEQNKILKSGSFPFCPSVSYAQQNYDHFHALKETFFHFFFKMNEKFGPFFTKKYL